MADIVARFIELKTQNKAIDEELSALETVILKEHRDDKRIKIVAGRTVVTITEKAYEKLNLAGIQTIVYEQRPKKFEEFDIEVQNILLKSEGALEKKQHKESIRVK